MKRIAIVIMAAAGLVAGSSLASEELAKKDGCLNCHNVTGAKKMGPALKDAAPKGEAAIVESLNDKKKHGSVKASDEDKKALAAWIAGMK
jgi:cytochrome c